MPSRANHNLRSQTRRDIDIPTLKAVISEPSKALATSSTSTNGGSPASWRSSMTLSTLPIGLSGGATCVSTIAVSLLARMPPSYQPSVTNGGPTVDERAQSRQGSSRLWIAGGPPFRIGAGASRPLTLGAGPRRDLQLSLIAFHAVKSPRTASLSASNARRLALRAASGSNGGGLRRRADRKGRTPGTAPLRKARHMDIQRASIDSTGLPFRQLCLSADRSLFLVQSGYNQPARPRRCLQVEVRHRPRNDACQPLVVLNHLPFGHPRQEVRHQTRCTVVAVRPVTRCLRQQGPLTASF